MELGFLACCDFNWDLFYSIHCILHQQSHDPFPLSEESHCHYHHGNGPYNDIDIPGCRFFKLPHKVSNFNFTLVPLMAPLGVFFVFFSL